MRAVKRRPRRWLSLCAAVALIALSWSAAPPASAHELTVVLVSAGSAQSADAGRGFKRRSGGACRAGDRASGETGGGADVRRAAAVAAAAFTVAGGVVVIVRHRRR